ncbi:multidrug effflux MFS transporter [Limnobacter parvus]|uniref:Bcr/CflA family efflux transporter n=1 Tax=Limnobacter parvus TaxID=2939690 RepID=A0ABT1XI39_9BURK|nr:multidrug effflux MFS transporter [Limnobacter parvus]MCR2746253.1 multidrug effflux MFS transporter [Limnobacter parvus]
MINRPMFFLLAALAAFAPLAIDLYLPSLAAIGIELQATSGQVQQTVTVFLAGFALGMLFYGPLSDRFGRRRMIFAGTSVFVLASVACMLAQTIEQLLWFRLIQAFGGGAAAVISRAVVRDLFGETDSARVMAMIAMVTSLAPMIAPLLGAYILELGSWRYEFLALALFGVACTVGAYLLLPETLSTVRSQTSIKQAFQGYRTVWNHPSARMLIFAGGGHFAAMFAYITGTPFVYIEFFGLSEKTYALLFGSNILALILFGYLSTRLVKRTGTTPLIKLGSGLGLLGAVLVLVSAFGGGSADWNLVLMVLGFLVCVGSLGFVAPNTTAQLLGKHPKNAGAASALYGCAQFGLGGMASWAVSLVHDNTALPMAATVLAFAALAFWASQRLKR